MPETIARPDPIEPATMTVHEARGCVSMIRKGVRNQLKLKGAADAE